MLNNIEISIGEAIDESNIETKINDAIEDRVHHMDIEDVLTSTVNDAVQQHIDPIAIKSIVQEIVSAKFSIFTEAKVIELFKEFLSTDPGLKKLIEDQTVLPVMKKTESVGMDTILIGIKPEATASFMWMIKGLMKDETIEIRKVNGQ